MDKMERIKWLKDRIEFHQTELRSLELSLLNPLPIRGANWDTARRRCDDVAAMIGIKHTIYSAFNHNLDEVAIEGRATLKGHGWDDEVYTVEVNNPTWLEVWKLSDEMVDAVKDHCHVFLEGVYKETKDNDCTTYIFSMGS